VVLLGLQERIFGGDGAPICCSSHFMQ